MEQEIENIDSQNDELETIDSTNYESEESNDSKEKKREFTEYEKQLYARNKELEAKLKAKQQDKSTSQTNHQLEQTDIIYLAKADIHEDDIGYLTEYANKFGISVKEAHNQVKPILAIRQEERTTAEATTTKSGRGKKPVTGDDLLDKANKTGEIPTDDRSMQELILARQKAGRR